MSLRSSNIRRIVVLLAVVVAGIRGGSGAARPVPQPMSPRRAVNDYAHLFSGTQQRALEEQAVRMRVDDSMRVAIVTADGWGDGSGDAYAAAILERWPVGDTVRGDGLVVLVGRGATDIYVAVGAAWREVLTAEQVRRVIDRRMIPCLHAAEPDYGRAVANGLTALAALVRGEEVPVAGGMMNRIEGWLALVAVGGIVLLLRRAYRRPVSRRRGLLVFPFGGGRPKRRRLAND